MIAMTRRSVLTAGASAPLLACAHGGPETQEFIAAYLFCFPLYEFARTGWAAAAPNAIRAASTYNTIAHRRGLSDHTHRAITAPNNDTIYSSARLDLSEAPVIVDIPSVGDRYFSVAFMNSATDNFAYVGTRATRGQGGRFLIAGPNWVGVSPAGVQVFRSETQDVWMLARVGVRDADDLAAANAVQSQVRIVSAGATRLLPVNPTASDGPEQVLGVANAMLARVSVQSAILKRAKKFVDTGVEAGALQAWTNLAEHKRQAWRNAAITAHAMMRDGGAVWAHRENGWRYPVHGIGGPGASDEVRAAIALSGLGALEREEATYVRADADMAGDMLDGRRAYRIVMPATIPVEGFWSLSLYKRELDGRLFFSENPKERYAISDRTQGLIRNSEGGIPIAIQNTPPAGEVNWFPAPEGPISLTFRAYLPTGALRAGRWRLPGIVALR
jgi:hypothetical protein